MTPKKRDLPPRKGSSFDLAGALKAAGWTKKEFAKRAGVHPNTVTAWVMGRREVPGIVVAYLDLIARLRALADRP